MIRVAIYARVSTLNRQDCIRQVSDLGQYATRNDYQVVAVITEHVSGIIKDRDGVKQLYDLVNSGSIDKVLVSEVSRLGRSPSAVLQILEDFTSKGVSLYCQNYGLETLTPDRKLNPAASLIYLLYSETARLEREQLRSRVISGLENARRKGKILGRPHGSTESDDEILEKYPVAVRRLREGHSLRNTCKLAEVSINTARKLKSILQEKMS